MYYYNNYKYNGFIKKINTMKITIKRIARKPTYTIGKLYVNGKYICDTLEDADRGLSQNMSLNELKARKIKGKTAIPTGTYTLSLNTISPRFGQQTFYKQVCGGWLPRLLDVPAFEGVLIHCGNTADDTDGCILVGRNLQVGKVLNSKDTFRSLYNDHLRTARKMGEKVAIEII